MPQANLETGQSIVAAPSSANHIHLLLCANALYLQHVAVCLASLLANNADFFFDIVLVGRAGEDLDGDKLRRSLAQFPNHSLSLRTFTPPADQLLPLNSRAHYTLDTWTRLWVDDFFPASIDRVLYLDCDIVVVGSIGSLWRTELDGALLGTVDIPGSQRGVTNLRMRAEDGYFNAGMLLINLEKWRRTRARDTVLDFVNANLDRLPDVDQDALNGCFHGDRKRLDYKWNVIWPFFREPLALPLAREIIEAVREEACIIHYNGGSKPWSYFCDHPRKGEYEKYLRMTEWRDFVPPDRTPMNRLRKGLSAILPVNVKELLKTIASQAAARGRAPRNVSPS